jgi:hypothetical protein
MGQQLFYSFCKSCGGMRGWFNRKTVFNECKCNREKPMYKKMYKKDFDNLNLILNDTSIDRETKYSNYKYWQKRINGRINDLSPLIKECKEKSIALLDLSPELHEEWIELHNVKLFYNF